ncbi:MAG: BON domain-containing protein [Terriglobales bacterium]
MRKQVLSILLASLFLCATVVAQSNAKPQSSRQTMGASVPDTERITRETRHELLMLPQYSLFDWLAYQVQGNKVVLMGEVTKPIIKSDAESAVKHIEGVDSVENRIEVLPPSPDDDRIRLAEYRAIYGSDSLNKYALGAQPPIHIIVKGGHVTLKGVVDSATDKNLAGIQANSVPGVFSVNNELMAGGSSALK